MLEWIKHDNVDSCSSSTENTNSHAHPTVMFIMGIMVYKKWEIKESIEEKKFHDVMATDLMLRQQVT